MGRAIDTDTRFIVKDTDPYTRKGVWAGRGEERVIQRAVIWLT